MSGQGTRVENLPHVLKAGVTTLAQAIQARQSYFRVRLLLLLLVDIGVILYQISSAAQKTAKLKIFGMCQNGRMLFFHLKAWRNLW